MKRILVFLGLMLLWAGVIGFACYGTSVSMDRIENPFAQPRYVWLITFAVLVFCYTVKKEFWKIAGKIAAKWAVLLCLLLPAVGWAEETNSMYMKIGKAPPASTVTIKPAGVFVLVNSSGDKARIDFSGSEVTWEGEMSLDDGAVLFFELFKQYLDEWCENKEATK